MSGWIVALLTEAFDRFPPPDGTHEQRVNHFLRRKRELEGRTELPLEPVDDAALDAELARLCADPEAQPFSAATHGGER